MSTNYSTAILLLNRRVKTIKVHYNPKNTNQDRYDDADGTSQDVKVFKTLDHSIVKGDIVVVPSTTRVQMTTALVIDDDYKLDPQSTLQLGWVVDRVNTVPYTEICEMEKEMIETLIQSERAHLQDEMAEKLRKLHEKSGVANMAIANFESIEAIEHKEGK